MGKGLPSPYISTVIPSVAHQCRWHIVFAAAVHQCCSGTGMGNGFQTSPSAVHTHHYHRSSSSSICCPHAANTRERIFGPPPHHTNTDTNTRRRSSSSSSTTALQWLAAKGVMAICMILTSTHSSSRKHKGD